MNWLPAKRSVPPSARPASMWRTRLPSWRMAVTRLPISARPPAATTRSRVSSHIIPGPRRGYRNESIRVLMAWPFARRRGGSTAVSTAVGNDRPLMRWLAQSAEISPQGIPQTFSV